MKAGDRLLTRLGFIAAASFGAWGVFNYVRGNADFLRFGNSTGGNDLSTSADQDGHSNDSQSGTSGAGASGSRGDAGSTSDGLVVVCQSKSGFYRSDPLVEDASYTVETPGTGAGNDAAQGTNRVVIQGGQVKVERANCANQVCVHHAPISKRGEQIVCLPHGLVIQIGKGEEDVPKLQ